MPQSARQTANDEQAFLNRERQRRKFRPTEVRLLFVAESPPAGGTFFYAADSNLYRYMRESFERAFGSRWSDEKYDFLDFFRKHGCYLDDLCLNPVNSLSDPDRRERQTTAIEGLANRLNENRPQLLIVIKKDIATHVNQACKTAGLEIRAAHVLPFPTMGWQPRFVSELTDILRSERVLKVLKISGLPARGG
jgi:hypothetical protein